MLNASREDRHAAVIPASLAASGAIAVVAVCQSGVIRAANPAFCRSLSYDSPRDIVGKSLKDELLARSSDWAAWQRTAATGEVHDVRFGCTAKNGSPVHFRGAIERLPPAGSGEHIVRAVVYDDSAGQQMQELAMRMAGMETMTTLTAGISHDFKNLLTVLVGNLYLISEMVEDGSPAREKLKRARDTAKRGADLAKQMLDLAVRREGSSEPATAELTNPRAVITKLVPLLSAALGGRVELRTGFADNVPSVAANRAYLESVVTNLVINARDSFGPEGGTVTVKVSAHDVGPPLATSLSVTPGRYVEISVQDDGVGIPVELREKVFEPFFSTKEKGKGCGLGLPMVRWFAERSGGAAGLASTPGKGTTVRLLLPAHQEELGDTTVLTMPLSTLPTGSETILVLSNNVDLRSMIRDILSTLGYQVILGTLGAAAETLFTHPSAAAVLIDSHGFTPPAAQQVRRWAERRSAQSRIIMIGDGSCELGEGASPIRVSKPFGLTELTNAVRQAVGG